MIVSKTSWRRLQDMSSRVFKTCLEDVFSATIFRLPRRFEDALRDVFKTSSRRLGRRKLVTLKTCWRRLQDISCRRLQHVFKTDKCLLGLLVPLRWLCSEKHREISNCSNMNHYLWANISKDSVILQLQ